MVTPMPMSAYYQEEERKAEQRREEERRQNRLHADKIDRVKSEREAAGQCINCGTPLGFWDRLSKRKQHPRCLSYQE